MPGLREMGHGLVLAVVRRVSSFNFKAIGALSLVSLRPGREGVLSRKMFGALGLQTLVPISPI